MNERLLELIKPILTNIFCILILISSISAQVGIVTAGGNATSNSGSVSYSVGQVFYLSHENTSGMVHEGIQQAYEIFTVDIPGVESGTEITLFPNPAHNYLVIRATEIQKNNLRYQLFDLTGQLLETKDLTGTETVVEVSELKPSGYFIHIMSENVTIKTFKLIKHSR